MELCLVVVPAFKRHELYDKILRSNENFNYRWI